MPTQSNKEALIGADITGRLKSLPQWKYEANALVRVQSFPSYKDALNFVHEVGMAAEAHDHHPDMEINYKRVTIKYSTHSAGGVTPLDFEMAGLVETLVKRFSGAGGEK